MTRPLTDPHTYEAVARLAVAVDQLRRAPRAPGRLREVERAVAAARWARDAEDDAPAGDTVARWSDGREDAP